MNDIRIKSTCTLNDASTNKTINKILKFECQIFWLFLLFFINSSLLMEINSIKNKLEEFFIIDSYKHLLSRCLKLAVLIFKIF